MKRAIFYFSFLTLWVVLPSCGGNDPSGEKNITAAHIDPENPPVMTFTESEFDFGLISQGQTVKKTFHFTNTGKSDLVIQSVKGSCGCTIPKSWPKDPIAPGEEGEIEVNFNSEGKQGQQNVTVTILANTVPTKNYIKLNGQVAVPGNANSNE